MTTDGARRFQQGDPGDIIDTTGTDPVVEREPGLYLIPDENLGKLTEKLVKLNKRAAKLGVTPITLTIEETIDRPTWFVGKAAFEDEAAAIKFARIYSTVSVVRAGYIREHIVIVDGEAPKLNGWVFTATIQAAGEAGNILRTVPGQTVPARYRDADGTRCEHCKTSRRRNDTYIVRHDDGTAKQVGSSCLMDFLGHANPQAAASWAELLGAFDEAIRGWETGGHEKHIESLDNYLTAAAASIRAYGWTSKGVAYERGSLSTAARIEHDLDLPKSSRGDRCWCGGTEYTPHVAAPVTPADEARAQAAIEWAHAIPADTESDYLHNVRVVCASDALEPRSYGIAASVITASERDRERAATRAQEHAERKDSQWVGEEGKRLDMIVTVKHTREIGSDFGLKVLHVFQDGDGNVIKWFSTTENLEVGTTVGLRGTVKRHSEYQGVKETILTRCKVSAVTARAEPTTGKATGLDGQPRLSLAERLA